MSVSEEQLLQQAVAGDAGALTRLLSAYDPALRQRWAGKIPRRWQGVLSVDDLLQQTYIDAFLHIRRFESRGEYAFFVWLDTIARRNLQDVLRGLQAEKRGGAQAAASWDGPGPAANAEEEADGSIQALWEELAGSTTTPSRQAARQETSDALRRAVARLPQPHRQVVELYDLEGRSVEDVAAVLQRSPGAVFMLRARAHRWLRELLGGASGYFSDSA